MKYSAGDVLWVDFLHLDRAKEISGRRRKDNGIWSAYEIETKNRPMLVLREGRRGWYVMIKIETAGEGSAKRETFKSRPDEYAEVWDDSFLDLTCEHQYPESPKENEPHLVRNKYKDWHTTLCGGAILRIVNEHRLRLHKKWNEIKA